MRPDELIGRGVRTAEMIRVGLDIPEKRITRRTRAAARRPAEDDLLWGFESFVTDAVQTAVFGSLPGTKRLSQARVAW